MNENVLKTLQQLVQEAIAPDVRESKVRIESLDKRVDLRFEQVKRRFDLLGRNIDLPFKAMMSALGEFKARTELASMSLIAALGERVAVLEAQRHWVSKG